VISDDGSSTGERVGCSLKREARFLGVSTIKSSSDCERGFFGLIVIVTDLGDSSSDSRFVSGSGSDCVESSIGNESSSSITSAGHSTRGSKIRNNPIRRTGFGRTD